MKCTQCGAYNKPDYTKCLRCGADLSSDSDNANKEKIIFEHKSPLDSTPTFRQTVIVEKRPDIIPDDITDEDKNAKKYNDEHKTKPKKRHNIVQKRKKTAPVIALHAEDSVDNPRAAFDLRGNISNSNFEKLSKIRGGTEVDIIIPAEAKKKKQIKIKKSGLKWGRLIFVSVLAASIIVGLIVGFISLFNGVISGAGSLFATHDEMPNGGKPLVERLLINGQTWHKITFYGEDGERILVEEPIRNLSIQEGEAVLLLDDFSYIPDEDTGEVGQEYIDVGLKASRFSLKGEETILDVPSYKISVPLSPLKIVYPLEQSLMIDYTQVLVKIKVEPGSRVIVDEINLTDIVDSDGYVSKYVNLDPGTNNILIEVETYKHRKSVEAVTVEHPILDVPIHLIEPDASSTTQDVNIKGQVAPGVSLYVDTSKLSAAVDIKENGDFEFRYSLNSYGWNEIEMIATAPDGKTSTLVHRIERIPDHRSYTKAAQKMDYDQLSTMAGSIIGRIFKCSGVIQKRIETDTSRMFLFNVGTEENIQFIMIEYNGRQDFEVGKRYDVYADVAGTFDNYPLLVGRFIYPIEEPEETEAPEATASP